MPEEIQIHINSDQAGFRIDAFLAQELPHKSRSSIQKVITEGDCLVNDKVVRSSYKLRPNDDIKIELPDVIPLHADAENIPINIVYEDEEIIVVNKPAGLVVHPGTGIKSGTLANALVYHFQQLKSLDAIRPGIVHRLDVGTSGLMVVAKNEAAQLTLAAQFEQRKVRKIYKALVYGVTNDEGKIEAPIGRDPRNRVKMSVRPEGQGRYALTFYKAVQRFEEFTLLDVQIKTGRTHQIRVHLSNLKFPIVGDVGYDSGRVKSVKDAQLRKAIQNLNRPFLHAEQLSFTHPNGNVMEFSAPMDENLKSFLELLTT